MYRTWTASADDADTLARELEVHLNEYAEEVVSICYAVSGAHHVLLVYREIEVRTIAVEEAAVAEAEHIIDGGPF
jgi:hypothetical protein